MNTITIGNRKIGNDYPTYVIAEIGINHQGNYDIAKKMIDKAKECGVDCVKFQKRSLEHIYRPEVLKNPHLTSISLGIYIPILKEVELDMQQHYKLALYCRHRGIDYLCSPWDIKSAAELQSMGVMGVKAFKIASVNLTDINLIKQVAGYGKPMIISTGMSSMGDIMRVHDVMLKYDTEYMFLHCVSTYPVDFKDVNLRMIEKLADIHKPVGYSGHERGIEISVCAVAMGASVIERHFTLDRTMEGPDHAASLEPEGLKRMCKHIRDYELARGSGVKRITRGEQIVREALGKEPIMCGNSNLVSKLTNVFDGKFD